MHSFQKNFSRSPKRIQKPEITKEYPLEYSVEKMSEKPVIYSLHLPTFFFNHHCPVSFISLELRVPNQSQALHFFQSNTIFTKNCKSSQLVSLCCSNLFKVTVYKNITLTCNKIDTAPVMTQVQRLRLSLHFQFSSYIAAYNNYSMICDRLASFQATHLNRLHNLQIKPAMSLVN